jgi:hypothetical protein
MNRHPSQERTPQRRRALVLLVVLAIIGCGKHKNEGEVSGTVTYQGKPLPLGTISFMDSSNHWLASSPIHNGTYPIQTQVPLKLPVGPVKITLTTPGSSSGERLPNVKNKRGEPISLNSIPAKYASADQSGLTYTVKPGANTYNIELP